MVFPEEEIHHLGLALIQETDTEEKEMKGDTQDLPLDQETESTGRRIDLTAEAHLAILNVDQMIQYV